LIALKPVHQRKVAQSRQAGSFTFSPLHLFTSSSAASSLFHPFTSSSLLRFDLAVFNSNGTLSAPVY
jgi:hypothetical protein